MTTTNGSGDPSMEEILASIRNIIAQDPSDQAAGDAPTEEPAKTPAGQLTASSPSPVSSSMASAGTAPDSHDPFAPGAGIDLRTTPAAGLLLPEDEPIKSEAAVAAQFSNPDLGSSTSAGQSGAAPAAPQADDFSDVFEEPLQGLPISPVPTAKADVASGNGAVSEELRLPNGTNGAGLPNGAPEPQLPRSDNSLSVAAAPAPAQRKEFDFGTLRPPRKNDTKPASVASELFGLSKPEKETPASEAPGLAQRLTEGEPNAPAQTEEDGGQPRRKVVIAAMPSSSSEPSAAAEPPASAKSETETNELESPATAPADFSPPAAANGEVGLKNANVGFLAATPRPIEPGESKATETGKAFFDAVAGESKTETVFPAAAPAVDSVAADVTEDAEEKAPTAEAVVPSAVETEAEIASETTASSEPDVRAAEVIEDVAAEDASSADKTAAAEDATAKNLSQGLSVANIVVSNDGGQVRTLEDTVAELLRPLLREWLENNMPRIVESALRLEVADSVKKQLEVSGHKTNGLVK